MVWTRQYLTALYAVKTPVIGLCRRYCAQAVADLGFRVAAGLVPLLPSALKQRIREIYLGETMSDLIQHVSDDSFEQDVLKAQGPVLVDYWAEWCGPCKMIAPILEDVAVEYAGKLKITKLNIDENQATPPKFGIRGIPTLMLFVGGEVKSTKVGALSKSQLTAFIDSNI
jgi:thioredoxin 1